MLEDNRLPEQYRAQAIRVSMSFSVAGFGSQEADQEVESQ